MNSRPRFFSSLLQSAAETYEQKGVLRLVPIWLFTGLVMGSVVAWSLPVCFWADTRVVTTVFAAFMTFNGLILALGWGVFSRIYATLNTRWMRNFLTRTNLLDDHLFFIEMTHAVLVLSAFVSIAGLVVVLLPVPLFVYHCAIATAIGLSFWSLIRVLSATKLMNDLMWESASNEEEQE